MTQSDYNVWKRESLATRRREYQAQCWREANAQLITAYKFVKRCEDWLLKNG